MRVRNLNGTSAKTCKCGSWLQHWMIFSRQALPRYCPVSGCIEKPEVGGHVQRDLPDDDRWYIIPICKACNRKTGETLTVSDGIGSVSANVSMTCGR